MPHFVVGKVVDALNRFRKSVNGAKVLVLGVAYKKNIRDVRESPALDILQLLAQKGAKLSYCDPHVPVLDEHGIRMKGEKFSAATLRKADCVVVVITSYSIHYTKLYESVRSCLPRITSLLPTSINP